MLNIEGRLRRRGDTKTKVLHVAEVLAGNGLANASHVDALQGACARQAARREASAQLEEDAGQVRQQAARRPGRARRFRGHARRRRRRSASAHSTISTSGSRSSSATRPRAAPRVLWAETPADVNALVLEIAAKHAVKKIIKSKSMVSEESALDHAIEGAGMKVVETDLGEYILQINDYEPPSHIIGPALHKSQGGGRRSLPQGARHAASRPASRSSASRRAACCASTT